MMTPDEVKDLLLTYARNAVFTAVVVVTWVIAGFVFGSIVAGVRAPDAARFGSPGHSYVSTESLNRYYAARDGIVRYFAWAGLVTAQVSFFLHESRRGRGRSDSSAPAIPPPPSAPPLAPPSTPPAGSAWERI